MRSIIFVGSSSSFSQYLEDFRRENNIKVSNIYSYQSLNIGDVRKMRTLISHMANGVRLFVVEGQVTLEAQNALLKSLEELPEDTYFIICVRNKNEVLATILSRCKIVFGLGEKFELREEINKLMVEYFEDPSLTSSLNLSQYIIKEEVSDGEILFLLSSLFRKEKSYSLSFVRSATLLFDQILDVKKLLEINNLNRKMTLETVFLRNYNLTLDKVF